MILLDTHMWYWWVDDQKKLSPQQLQHLLANESSGLGVSVISCWEIAKLVSSPLIAGPPFAGLDDVGLGISRLSSAANDSRHRH